MKNIVSIYLLLFSTLALAKETEKVAAEYYVKSDIVDSKLTAKQAKFKFEIENTDVVKSTMRISVNGTWKTVNVKNHQFEVNTQPGSYKFQLLLNKSFYEIKTESIGIEAKHVKTIVLNFRSSEREIMEEKPVIYVYGEQEQEITITLQPKGELTFTYPQTEASWTGKITSKGFQIGEITYPYLFWEAKQTISQDKLDWTEASIVSQSELMNYLDLATAKIGMNSTEKTDFITYWGPRMAKYENLEIQFITENVDGLIGGLLVSDKSYTIQRVYVLFRGIEKQESKINLSSIETIKRPSHLIFEWGGSEILEWSN